MRRSILLLFLPVIFVTACDQQLTAAGYTVALETSQPSTSTVAYSGEIIDYDSFLMALTYAGAKPVPQENINHQFLSVPGKVVMLGSQHVQVFEYRDRASADADGQRFSPDGAWFDRDGIPTLVNWIATPHLYRTGKLLIVYVGDDVEMLSLLEITVGQEFAGGANPYGEATQIEF